MTLPEYLEEERKKRGLNKARFAAALGMHQTQLERLLALVPGKIPKSDTLKKLAAGLGCTENELIALCYGNPTSSDLSKQRDHGLRYGNCYEVIDASVEISEKNREQRVLTTSKIAETLCSQDEARYNPIKACAGTSEQWQEIFERYPDSAAIFYFVRESNGKRSLEIAGDWSLVFLHPSDFNKLNKDGTIAEDQITYVSLPSMPLFKGECDVVILNMSLANRYNEQKYTSVLIDSFVSRIRQTPNDIIIKNLYVNVYERDLAFYKELGFEQCNPDAKPSTDSDGKNIPILFKYENNGSNDKFQFSKQKEGKKE